MITEMDVNRFVTHSLKDPRILRILSSALKAVDPAVAVKKYLPLLKGNVYGLGIGKPDEIVKLSKMGYQIFDCVLPTRDARHKRLYVYNAKSIDEIDVDQPKFYSYYTPDKERYFSDSSAVSTACDCLLCTKYSKGYLSHLFKTGEMLAMRLASIHNLRFYSILMEKLQK